MIIRIRKKKNSESEFVEPDEIFLDSANLAGFDRQQFEGRIEKPISKKVFVSFSVFFALVFGVFGAQLWHLQVEKGEAYLARSEQNTLRHEIIFSERGIIYDRNGKELAWNEILRAEDQALVEYEKGLLAMRPPKRSYLSPGFSHLLGYVSYPTEDRSGKYWRTEFEGKDGLEKEYDSLLKGVNGSKIVEVDAKGKTYSENIVDAPARGMDLQISIDSRIQTKLFLLMEDFAKTHAYSGGAGVIMNVKNGEILASVSFPEYDSKTLSLGKDAKRIEEYLKDSRKVFLDRTISGLYTPGSTIKPFLAVAALAEGIIDPYKKILSTGSISIPNPYFPGQETVYKDWRAHGWTDMREAIAVSSDVYFYSIGGGFEGQRGLGVGNIEKYARIFGIGQATGVDLPDEKGGVIPNPEWKIKNFSGEPWRIGDTYHTSIGQYGFQVTPMELARATAALASPGILPRPHYALNGGISPGEVIAIPGEYLAVAREGMRLSVVSGTSSALLVPYLEVAAKTGTAQIGISKKRVNSWIIGFFPYRNPKWSFALVMESGPANSASGASILMRSLLDWMHINTPEYLK